MVEKKVNDHTGHGDVKPDRHRPAPEAAMSVPVPLKHRNERHDHERECDESQQNMRSQNRKIDDGHPAGVAGRFFARVNVINNVADKK